MPTTPRPDPTHLEIHATGPVDDIIALRRALQASGRFTFLEMGPAKRVDQAGRWRQYLRLSVRYQVSPTGERQETLV
ncbi:MAG TPA: hypothetical protein VHA75_17735 [Rugosimonospora sp.]|nr:hypothetical protein [Rugosimonospora sp.]